MTDSPSADRAPAAPGAGGRLTPQRLRDIRLALEGSERQRLRLELLGYDDVRLLLDALAARPAPPPDAGAMERGRREILDAWSDWAREHTTAPFRIEPCGDCEWCDRLWMHDFAARREGGG